MKHARTLAEMIEHDVDIAGAEYAQHVLDVVEAMGDRALFAKRVSDDENLTYYLRMRKDPLEWKGLIDQHGVAGAAAFGVAMDKLLEKKARHG